MFKEKVFKFLFPNKQWLIESLEKEVSFDSEVIKDLRGKSIEKTPSMADLMMDGLGLPMLNFANADEKGKPPHFYQLLSEEERKNYVVSMATIYRDRHFQEAVAYTINLLGNHALLKTEDDAVKNGRMAMLGVKTLLSQFEKADLEHRNNNKPQEEFDPLEALPE